MAKLLTAMFASALAGSNITCPVLTCDTPLPAGTCFQHDGNVPVQQLKGGLCFDVTTEPITALPYFCPFTLQTN